MWQSIAILNAFWVAGIIIAKLDGNLSCGWPFTLAIAFAPFVIVCLLCWWAVMYDAFHSTPNQ